MSKAETKMGRPATGRGTVLQSTFDTSEAKAIKAYAKRTGKTVSVVLREWAVEGMARAKKTA